MRKNFFWKTMLLLLTATLFLNLSSFTNDNTKYCTAVVHVKNWSTTRTITRLRLSHPTGTVVLSVSIPPGGTYDPAFGNFLGNAGLIVNLSSSTTAGTLDMRQLDYDGPPVSCTDFSGSTGGVTWSAGCSHYYLNVYDNGSFCN